MNLKELIFKIDEDYYKANAYYLSINEPEAFAEKVALEFGRQCFEAGFIMGARSEAHGGFDEPDFDNYLKTL